MCQHAVNTQAPCQSLPKCGSHCWCQPSLCHIYLSRKQPEATGFRHSAGKWGASLNLGPLTPDCAVIALQAVSWNP